jgi:hypothetical protein
MINEKKKMCKKKKGLRLYNFNTGKKNPEMAANES